MNLTLIIPFGFAAYLAHDDEISGSVLALPENLIASHPNRQRDWLTSRKTLIKAFGLAGIHLSPDDLVSDDFQTLRSQPDWKFSLSHSDEGSLAWVVPRSLEVQIGVDLELADRPTNLQILDRIHNPADIQVEPIRLWSLKESIFKCLNRPEQEALRFSNISIAEDGFKIENRSIQGLWSQALDEQQIFSFAWIPANVSS